jgi:hypothetical protein
MLVLCTKAYDTGKSSLRIALNALLGQLVHKLDASKVSVQTTQSQELRNEYVRDLCENNGARIMVVDEVSSDRFVFDQGFIKTMVNRGDEMQCRKRRQVDSVDSVKFRSIAAPIMMCNAFPIKDKTEFQESTGRRILFMVPDHQYIGNDVADFVSKHIVPNLQKYRMAFMHLMAEVHDPDLCFVKGVPQAVQQQHDKVVAEIIAKHGGFVNGGAKVTEVVKQLVRTVLPDLVDSSDDKDDFVIKEQLGAMLVYSACVRVQADEKFEAVRDMVLRYFRWGTDNWKPLTPHSIRNAVVDCGMWTEQDDDDQRVCKGGKTLRVFRYLTLTPSGKEMHATLF